MKNSLTNFLLLLLALGISISSCSDSSNVTSNAKQKAKSSTSTPMTNNVKTLGETSTTANAKEEKTILENSKSNGREPKVSNKNIIAEKKENSSEEADIQFIRNKYSIITKAINYKIDSTSVNCEYGTSRIERRSTDKGELRFLLESSCGNHGCVTTEHYFWDNELIFIFQQNYYYAGNSDYMIEHRTYFKNKKMFGCLEKDVSTDKGYEVLQNMLKKASNTTVDCKPKKRTANLQQLIDLDLDNAKDLFCS